MTLSLVYVHLYLACILLNEYAWHGLRLTVYTVYINIELDVKNFSNYVNLVYFRNLGNQ